MILTGQNFTAESKVVFTEKTSGRALFFLTFPNVIRQTCSTVVSHGIVLRFLLVSTSTPVSNPIQVLPSKTKSLEVTV